MRCSFSPWVRKIPWRRKQQPAPVFLPGKSHGQRSLVGYSPWGRKRVRHVLVTQQQQTSMWGAGQRGGSWNLIPEAWNPSINTLFWSLETEPSPFLIQTSEFKNVGIWVIAPLLTTSFYQGHALSLILSLCYQSIAFSLYHSLESVVTILPLLNRGNVANLLWFLVLGKLLVYSKLQFLLLYNLNGQKYSMSTFSLLKCSWNSIKLSLRKIRNWKEWFQRIKFPRGEDHWPSYVKRPGNQIQSVH